MASKQQNPEKDSDDDSCTGSTNAKRKKNNKNNQKPEEQELMEVTACSNIPKHPEREKKNKNEENNQHRNTNSSKGDGVVKKAEKKRNAGADVDSCNNPDESKELNEAVDQEKQPVSPNSEEPMVESTSPMQTNRSSTNDSPSNTGSHEGGEERTEDGNNADPDKDPNPSSTNDSPSNTGSHEGGEDGAEVGDNADPDKESNPSSTNDSPSNTGSHEGGEEGAENGHNADPDKDSCKDVVIELDEIIGEQNNEKNSDVGDKQSTELSNIERDDEIKNSKEADESQKEESEKIMQKMGEMIKERESDIARYLLEIDQKNEECQTRSEFIEATVKKHIALAEENSQLESQIVKLQSKLDNLNEIETRLTQDKEDYDKARKKYEDNIKTEKNKLKQEKDEHEKTKKNYKESIKAEKDKHEKAMKAVKKRYSDELSSQRDKANKEKLELRNQLMRKWQTEQAKIENQIREQKSTIQELNRAYNNAVFENSHLDSQLRQQRQNNSILEAEKEELLSRLSKIAGAKLTYNNPNIADLSDEKRPTKLAEEFSELYDNEWTDAFEMIDGYDDEQKTSVLYDILKHASEYCGNLSSGHDEAIEKSFVTLEYVKRLSDRDSTDSGIPKTNNPNHELKKSSAIETDQHELSESQTPDSSQKMDMTTPTHDIQDNIEDHGFVAVHKATLPSGNGENISHNKSENEEGKTPIEETSSETSEDAKLAPDEGGQCTHISNTEDKKYSEKSENDSATITNGTSDESEQPKADGDKGISMDESKYNDNTTKSDAKEVNQVKNTANEPNAENCKSEKKMEQEHIEIGDCKGIDPGELGAEADNKSIDIHGNQSTIGDDKSDFENDVSTVIDKENEAAENRKKYEIDGENFDASEKMNKESQNSENQRDEQSSVASDGSRHEHDDISIFGKDGESNTGKPNSENEDGVRTDSYRRSDDQNTEPKDTGSDKKDDNVTIKHKMVSKLDFKFDEFTTEQKNTIMDMKKTCEDMQTQDVIEVGTKIIADEMNIKPELDEVMKYISKCIEICWSMYRHVPPVHINFCTDLVGACLDKNVYRPYTKSGKHIKFVVWPALYLHKGGPLLGKGVAQGKD